MCVEKIQRRNKVGASKSLKYVLCAPLVLLGEQAIAAYYHGTTVNVGPSTPLDWYGLSGGATLNMNDGAAQYITAARSNVNINVGTVTNTSSALNSHGIAAHGSVLDLNKVIVIANGGLGIIIGRDDTGQSALSSATITGSDISGNLSGIRITGLNTLVMNDTRVTGTGAGRDGMEMQGSSVTANNGSVITGNRHGVNLQYEFSGDDQPKLLLDNSSVIAQNGAALFVTGASTLAEIEIRNGSSLKGDNVLELAAGSSANVLVSGSYLEGNVQVGVGSMLDLNMSQTTMVGDVIVTNGGAADLALSNGSSLTGRVQNLANLSLSSHSVWTMTGDSQVDKLVLSDGVVEFGAPGAFYQLNLGELSGNGTFVMSSDFANGQTDFLNVSGNVTGAHNLLISSSGADPLAASSLHVVHSGGGAGTFSLLGGPVDLGTWSYDLIQRGDDWYLDADSKTVSTGTQSILALSEGMLTASYGELTSLRSRMGELRFNGAQTGAWIRTYGNKYKVADNAGFDYQQVQRGTAFGADAPLPGGNGEWLVGVMAGTSKSDLSLVRGTTATIDSYYMGLYTTWLDAANGYYFDGVLKLNRFDNESKVVMSDGQQVKGKFKDYGVGASAEFGRHIKLDRDFFVEPSVQVAAMAVSPKKYQLDNGLTADSSATRSLLGKAGVTVGRSFEWDQGRMLQPYVRAGAVHEFVGSNKVLVNGNKFETDLSGSRVEVGTGVAMTLSKNVQVHADFDYADGKKITKPWGANVGLRISF